MANPRGNPNFKKKIEESPDIEQLRAKLEQAEKELAALKSNDEILIIPDDAKIELRTNVGGKFILREDRGKASVYIPFAGYRSTARIQYDDLRLVYGSKPEFFRSGKLAITKVYCENKKITIHDIYRDLGLESIYLDVNKLNPVDIEDVFNDKVTEREFERLVSHSSELSDIILEVAVILSGKAVFNNATKMAYLRQIYGNQNLFR